MAPKAVPHPPVARGPVLQWVRTWPLKTLAPCWLMALSVSSTSRQRALASSRLPFRSPKWGAHPVQGAEEVHRRGAALPQEAVRLLEVLPRHVGQDHAEGGGNPDGRGPPHHHAPDGLGHLPGGVHGHPDLLLGKAPLVQKPENPFLLVKTERQKALHAPSLSQAKHLVVPGP
jgi:hypothetical protein